MKLHKRLTTVTDFSKAVAGVLFVGIPIITFFLGYQYGIEAEQATELYRKSIQTQPALDVMKGGSGMINGMLPLDKKPAPGTMGGDVATQSMMLAGPNAIVAQDQGPGRQITVANVVFEKTGYVVIHRADATGQAGAVIGQSGIISGKAENVAISLKEMVAAGDTLIAMLHTDDGDGVYEFPGADMPLKDDAGSVVQMKFSITPQGMSPTGAAAVQY